MPHSRRDDRPDAAFHVTGRVNWSVWHLVKPGATELFLHIVDEQVDRHAVDLLGFAMMANHYHLILRSPPEREFDALTTRRTRCRHMRRWPASHYKSSVLAQCMRQILQPFAQQLQKDSASPAASGRARTTRGGSASRGISS